MPECTEIDEHEGEVIQISQLSSQERIQIESCFRALSTQVYVCSSLANLYVSRGADWELKHTGVPVILLDTGKARARSSRGIRIVLAERGSCLAIWHDKIDNLSTYKKAAPAFHTMCLSTDHTVRIGLSFDCQISAEQLWNHIEKLTSCPENICLSIPGARKSRNNKEKHHIVTLPAKSHISQPCCFQHVTSVGPQDRYASLQTLLNQKLPTQEKN